MKLPQNSPAVERATDFYNASKQKITKYVGQLKKQRGSPYRLEFIRLLLRLSEDYLQSRYKQQYSIDFAVGSGILARFNRQSVVVFNDAHARIYIDGESTSQVRLYWVMHELAHIFHSFEEFDESPVPHSLLLLNYEPRKLDTERSYFQFAFTLLDKTFREYSKQVPASRFQSLNQSEVWSLVQAFTYAQKIPVHEASMPHPIIHSELPSTGDDERGILQEALSDLALRISRNLSSIEDSTHRIERALEKV